MEIQRKLFSKERYWSKYNRSQTQEKTIFLRLLKEICNTVPDSRIALLIFSICVKQYSMKSARRIIGELELCKRAGLIYRVPHFNSILNGMNRSSLTPFLENMIEITSLPLRAVERKFCCDSSGFGLATLHDRWSVIRSQYDKHHKYMKAHIAFGTLTNIVVSCKITEGSAADSPQLPELLDKVNKGFNIEEWSADKGYLSRTNYETIFNRGALPLIPFKSNSSPTKKNSAIWQEMYHFFKKNNELFMKKYHLRSNAESGFFMIKSRFGDLTMMKNDRGCVNDLLSKILCHNLCVLVQELCILGIEINFNNYKEEVKS